jgi:predicted phosphate transport protein (TIGR00153 family)
MFTLKPKSDKFYDLFISYAEIVYKSAEMLKKFTGDLSGAESKFNAIKEVEHDGDQQLHIILKELNASFITPIDREDIYMIAKQMDDIVDYIETTASRFVILNIQRSTEEALNICSMLASCSHEVINLMNEFKHAVKSKKLADVIIEINRIEEEADKAFRKAVKNLFTGDMPVLEIIKWKEIYEYLEKSINACEDVANSIEGVVMKHA